MTGPDPHEHDSHKSSNLMGKKRMVFLQGDEQRLINPLWTYLRNSIKWNEASDILFHFIHDYDASDYICGVMMLKSTRWTSGWNQTLLMLPLPYGVVSFPGLLLVVGLVASTGGGESWPRPAKHGGRIS